MLGRGNQGQAEAVPTRQGPFATSPQTVADVSVTASVLPPGAATDTALAAINTTLGSPLQTGGTVVANQGAPGAAWPVNAAQSGTWNVGITGTLPAFAATPTVNVGTVQGYSFQNISTSTTTTVKSGAGVLHGINVNTKGTVASTVTVYDNTAGSGAIIAILDSLNLSGWNQFDISFATGLTLVTTGAPNITVAYR